MSIAMNGNFVTQFFYYMFNSYSIVWFVTSAIPSV